MPTLLQNLAGALSRSWLLSSGRKLWEINEKNYLLPLSKPQKVVTGLYIIFRDYAEGRFPPTFTDQQKAYDDEIALRFCMPGLTAAEFSTRDLRKPFWFGHEVTTYLQHFAELSRTFDKLKVRPPQRILELGCGTGWMSEFLAMMGFEVLAVDISPDNIDDANRRIESIIAKGITPALRFVQSPMESVADDLAGSPPPDAVFLYEALHHAYDWRRTLESAFRCLKPGGWLLIGNEPNVLHTCIAYRGARLTSTHEVGLSRGELRSHLKAIGFRKPIITKNWAHFFVRPHWICAQKPGTDAGL